MTEVARLALRLGISAFGGPAAHIAMLHDEVVIRRGWIDEQHFLDLVGATNLIPGPNSTEMVMHVGHERAGLRGLILAGTLFILPAALIVTALAALYVRFGTTPTGGALLVGIKPVVVVIILQALLRLGRRAARTPALAAITVAAAALYLLGVNELLLLAGGALLALLPALGQRGVAALLLWPPMLLLPAAQAAAGSPTPRALFLFFLKVGAVLYGSGYVLLAFIRSDLVLRMGWLTDAQLLDAIAIGQLTPGPVLTTATFVGYLTGGPAGAVAATVAIFLPSFVFVALLNPLVPRLRGRADTAALLDGVNAAALGLMAGVTAQLARAAIVDAPTLLLTGAAALLLFRYRLSTTWLVAGGAAAGLLLARLSF